MLDIEVGHVVRYAPYYDRSRHITGVVVNVHPPEKTGYKNDGYEIAKIEEDGRVSPWTWTVEECHIVGIDVPETLALEGRDLAGEWRAARMAALATSGPNRPVTSVSARR